MDADLCRPGWARRSGQGCCRAFAEADHGAWAHAPGLYHIRHSFGHPAKGACPGIGGGHQPCSGSRRHVHSIPVLVAGPKKNPAELLQAPHSAGDAQFPTCSGLLRAEVALATGGGSPVPAGGYGKTRISDRNRPTNWDGSFGSIEPSTNFSRATCPSQNATFAFCVWRKCPLG